MVIISVERVQDHRTTCPNWQSSKTTSLPYENLCSRCCCCQVTILVLHGLAQEIEEICWWDCCLLTGNEIINFRDNQMVYFFMTIASLWKEERMGPHSLPRKTSCQLEMSILRENNPGHGPRKARTLPGHVRVQRQFSLVDPNFDARTMFGPKKASCLPVCHSFPLYTKTFGYSESQNIVESFQYQIIRKITSFNL